MAEDKLEKHLKKCNSRQKPKPVGFSPPSLHPSINTFNHFSIYYPSIIHLFFLNCPTSPSPIQIFLCPFINLSVHLPIYLFIYRLLVHSSIRLFSHSQMHPFIYPCFRPSTHPFCSSHTCIYSSIHLHIYPCIYIHLYIYLFVYIFIARGLRSKNNLQYVLIHPQSILYTFVRQT